jgi:TusE/DsrC/DsvC family sulfur relay protein
MATFEYKGNQIRVDGDGFLADQNDWNEEVALALASQEGIDSLSTEQMEIIRFMREYFLKFKVFPILNNVCRMAHQPKRCVDEQFADPEKAWKIAGLPKQEGVHFISFDGRHFSMDPYC